jgi:uncharacterized protein involved in outer membrane biogenesis
MKKILIRLLMAIVVLVVLAVIAAALFLDGAIKRGVETVGPMLTKVEVKLDSVHVSMLSGGGKIKGLLVGNPEGFKTPSAIKVGTATLALQPSSVLSDKVVIKTINVQAPEITFETDLRRNNLSKILANLDEVTGGGTKQPAGEKKATGGKKLQVDDFLISGGKINVSLTTLGGKALTVPLPEIHLTQLGTGPEGITPGELVKLVLQEVEKVAASASQSAVGDLSKQANELGKQAADAATKSATDAAGKATKSVTDIFKKK